MASTTTAPEEEEEDDYLTLPLSTLLPTSTTTSTPRETLTQRKRRLARLAEERAHPKSKAEIARLEREKRDAGLNTKMDTSSKGFKMLEKLGYKPGTALGRARDTSTTAEGKEEDGDLGSVGVGESGEGKHGRDQDGRLLEPIGLEQREGRSGIGADSEKKRKFREEVERQADGEKRMEVDEGEFRERSAREREERKIEGQMYGAMKVCERLDEQAFESGVEEGGNGVGKNGKGKRRRRLKDINVLWRGLVKSRLEREREKKMKYDFHQSFSARVPKYEDPDEEDDDRVALGKKKDTEEVDGELDDEDEELEEFEALDAAERLRRIVLYLRQRWRYCFWCMYRYPDEGMEGCPGVTEEDHD